MRQDADRCIRRSEALCALRYLLAEDAYLSVCVCHPCTKGLSSFAGGWSAAQKSPANADTSVYAVQTYLHGAHGEGYSSLWPYIIQV